MIRTIGPARLGFAAALLALLLGPLALGFHTAHAQGPDVAQYYGTGLSEGDAVGCLDRRHRVRQRHRQRRRRVGRRRRPRRLLA